MKLKTDSARNISEYCVYCITLYNTVADCVGATCSLSANPCLISTEGLNMNATEILHGDDCAIRHYMPVHGTIPYTHVNMVKCFDLCKYILVLYESPANSIIMLTR